MLAATSQGSGSPTLILMHFLGGAAREWQEVVAALGPDVHTLAVDLPGFGESAAISGYTVAQMADHVAALIQSLALDRYILVGHSLSGKVATVLAGRQLPGLEGLILIAPSPLAPEPMTDTKRSEMLANLGTPREGDRDRARTYVTKNELRKLEPAVLDRATDDVLRMNRAAWVAWLEHGSREDWTDWASRTGPLTLPTLILVGEQDTSLGLEVQQRLTLPHFANARIQIIPECGHLIPLEKSIELAAILSSFLAIPTAYLDFIHSDRVSPRTREILLERLEPRKPSTSMNQHQLATLKAVVARVIPQPGPNPIDISGFIAQRLDSGQGDGWRYAVLPPDCEAYAASLGELDKLANLLHNLTFANLKPEEQDAILTQIAARGPIDAPHLFRWFEDLRADAAQAWMAHPRTLAGIGYSGIGIGGATTPHAGFVTLGPSAREAWEPEPQP